MSSSSSPSDRTIAATHAVAASGPNDRQHALLLEAVVRGDTRANRPAESPLRRGLVRQIRTDGTIVVQSDGGETVTDCDVLLTGFPYPLHAGDAVLIHCPTSHAGRGCVLGRVSVYQEPAPPAPAEGPARAESAVPESIVLQASESISLRCGKASVDLRADGKVMVRGENVLNRAKRLNQIKGGSVAIN